MSSFALSRALRVLGLAGMTCFATVIIYTIWYGMNSDRDDIHPLLTQLIPAGHCACETATVFECPSCLSHSQGPLLDSSPSSHWEYVYERDAQNEAFTEDQCNAAFPGLFEDVDRGVKFWGLNGNITQQSLDVVQLVNSMTRAMFYKGNLYVIATKSKTEDHRRKMIATLGSIHRALTAFPDRASIPDIEFVFSVEDKVDDIAGWHQPLWVLARKASEESLWLMPDFGFWAWDNVMFSQINEIGSYDEVVSNALHVEKTMDFSAKKPKLIWRGKLSFAPKLRRALLDQSRDQPWSDVKELNSEVQQNYLTLEDHCRYQFIAHAEGRSYSASLKYRQACRSVIITHNLQYMQHHHYLLVSSGPLQNYVEVARDFSDLAAKMANLLDHPAKAQKIADNNVKTFRERYLTPAAEACYWRVLWRGYAQASEPSQLWVQSPDGEKEKRGVRYETFLLLSSQDMLDFRHTLTKVKPASAARAAYGTR